jgi:hypothetical protein
MPGGDGMSSKIQEIEKSCIAPRIFNNTVYGKLQLTSEGQFETF